MKNPKKLIALDMVDQRLEKAAEFGADLVWNPDRVDVVKKIMELTDGYGSTFTLKLPVTHPA
jgi:L-iditol 2-dehydrogenase